MDRNIKIAVIVVLIIILLFTSNYVIFSLIAVATAVVVISIVAAPTVYGGGHVKRRKPPQDKGAILFERFRKLKKEDHSFIFKKLYAFFIKYRYPKESISDILLSNYSNITILEKIKKINTEIVDNLHPASIQLSPNTRSANKLYAIMDLLPPRKNISGVPFRYIDIGAGDGSITEAIAKDFNLPPGRAIAADIYMPKQTNPSVEHVLTDGKTLEFGDNMFSLITMFMSAHHFSDPIAMFNEVHRIAMPGATLIMLEHSLDDWQNKLFYDIIHSVYEINNDNKSPSDFIATYIEGKYAQYYTPAKWIAMLKNIGFQLDIENEPKKRFI